MEKFNANNSCKILGKVLFTGLLCFLGINGFGQGENRDSVLKEKIADFKYALDHQFTKITTGTAFSTLGNFASVASDAKTLAIAGSIVRGRSILGLELSGGATEGIFRVFNQGELNSNFAGELKYHRRLNMGMGSKNAYEIDDINKQIKAAHEQFVLDTIAIVNRQEYYKQKQELDKIRKKFTENTSSLAKVESLMKISGPVSYLDSLSTVRGLLLNELEVGRVAMQSLETKVQKFESNTADEVDNQMEKRQQKWEADSRQLVETRRGIQLREFDISWFSMGFKLKNNDFSFYNPGSALAEPIRDTNFVSQRFTATYSRYVKTLLNNDVYWSAGVYVNYGTNFSGLKKIDIVQRTSISGSSQREITKTIVAYQGAYKEDIWEISAFYDYYRFFRLNSSSVGIHINPNYVYDSFSEKGLFNLYLGVILPVFDAKEQKTRLNIEVFYNRADLLNTLRLDTKLGSFGLRGTLPITVLNNKS